MPQLHDVIDDWFTIIGMIETDEDFVTPDNRDDLFQVGRFNCLIEWNPLFDGLLIELSVEWLSECELDVQRQYHEQTRCAFVSLPVQQHEEDNASEDEVLPAPQGVEQEDSPPLLPHHEEALNSNNDADEEGRISSEIMIAEHDRVVLTSIPQFDDLLMDAIDKQIQKTMNRPSADLFKGAMQEEIDVREQLNA
eukprot:9831151-Ditylum_brightwellii.AAC.1